MKVKEYSHHCDHLPRNGVYVEFSEEKKLVWKLYIQRQATESHLAENHYLETVGETIWTTEIEIVHCPYCGEKLPGLGRIDRETYGRFRHIDSSGWSSTVK